MKVFKIGTRGSLSSSLSIRIQLQCARQYITGPILDAGDDIKFSTKGPGCIGG